MARIDTPRLQNLWATFFNDIEFDNLELIRFLSPSSTFKTFNKAVVVSDDQHTAVALKRQPPFFAGVTAGIKCSLPDWQLSSLAQICTSFFPLLSTTEDLFVYEQEYSQLNWENGMGNIEWLELLFPFTAVKNLYLSELFAPLIAPALQETTGSGTTEVLPSLQNLYLEGFRPSESVPEDIEGFISARQATSHPVAISVWDRVMVRDK